MRGPVPLTTSKATPYLPYLQQRLAAGCDNARQLWKEIQAQGFTGSYPTIWRIVLKLNPGGLRQTGLPYRFHCRCYHREKLHGCCFNLRIISMMSRP